jgi:hypothetical protein
MRPANPDEGQQALGGARSKSALGGVSDGADLVSDLPPGALVDDGTGDLRVDGEAAVIEAAAMGIKARSRSRELWALGLGSFQFQDLALEVSKLPRKF